MYINQIFELSMVLDNEKFQKVLNRAYKKTDCLQEDEGEYIDQLLAHKGITVVYCDSQYKKKVKLIVDSKPALDSSASDMDKFIRKLDKYIKEYLISNTGWMILIYQVCVLLWIWMSVIIGMYQTT